MVIDWTLYKDINKITFSDPECKSLGIIIDVRAGEDAGRS